MNRDALITAPRLLRAPVARGIKDGDEPRIEREGGAYGAGLIRGAAVITRGEALGHEMWIDGEMLEQVTEAINAADAGIKSRFHHPSLSGDGLGRALGRYRNGTLDGDLVRADIHLFQTAHKTPDGDLAEYVMSMAEEDPEAFGNSIAFDADLDAMEEFQRDHKSDKGQFVSPDENNVSQYPHARLAELSAVDAVDEPAANPGGLFHRGDEIAFAADAMLDYVLGRTSDAPVENFGIAPERIRAYFARYLDNHGLRVVEVEPAWRKSARVRALELDED